MSATTPPLLSIDGPVLLAPLSCRATQHQPPPHPIITTQEEEAERVLAPETMCEEEERLRLEREEAGVSAVVVRTHVDRAAVHSMQAVQTLGVI